MINWNYDIEAAKQAGWVLICLDDEKRWLGLSCWLEFEQRWNMIGTKETPHAWSEMNHPLSDTPFVKPLGINTATPPPMKPQKAAPEAFVKKPEPATLPPGVTVALPFGVG